MMGMRAESGLRLPSARDVPGESGVPLEVLGVDGKTTGRGGHAENRPARELAADPRATDAASCS